MCKIPARSSTDSKGVKLDGWDTFANESVKATGDAILAVATRHARSLRSQPPTPAYTNLSATINNTSNFGSLANLTPVLFLPVFATGVYQGLKEFNACVSRE